jgi:Cu-processing system ATP-binding protein
MDHLRRIAALGDVVVDVNMTPPGLEELYRYYSQESAQ